MPTAKSYALQKCGALQNLCVLKGNSYEYRDVWNLLIYVELKYLTSGGKYAKISGIYDIVG